MLMSIFLAIFDEECSQDNYLSESLNSPLNQPLMNYSNILNPTCETVIQSPHKEENHSNTMSSPSNVQLFTESNDMRTISDTNNSTDDFLDELFGSKSIENEIIENDYQSETSKNDNLVPSSDLKHKIEDADIFFTDTNQSSHDNPSFQISEVNEQNEATEFNQEIFERSSDTNKNTKVPQLLNFSSKQLFTDIPSKSNSDVIDNKNLNYLIKMEEQINYSEKKDNLNEVPIIVEDGKSRPADAESICSDTTDITIPEVKTEAEISHIVPNEEPAQEEFHVDDVTSLAKPKIDRPRRGRRPKTRKYTEAIALKQDIEPSPNMTLTRSSSRRVRQASLEKIRRSLRSDASESHVLRESTKKRFSVDEPIQSETDEMKKDTSEEANDNFVSDPTVLEVDCTSGIVPSVIIDRRLTDKSQIKHEEPKRRRGRRKKASGDNQNSLLVDKMESKFDECETSKDLHRPKESRLWLSLSSCDKETKSSKDNTSRAIDVYEFVDEEDDRALTFESVKEKLHDTTRNSTTVNDSKNEKNDLKHNKIFEIKHDKGIEKTTEQKHEKGSDQKHEKGNDQKKHERGNDQKHDKGLDLKLDRGIDNVFEKEKKGDSKKLAAVEEAGTREHHPEVKEQKRISITIRLHQKDGHDGTSPGTAEVVKTSETVNIEEVKPECIKNEKSSKHDVSTPEAPCKSTRKSTRLMKQAAQRSIIEEVVKSSGKNALHSEPVPTRVTRRSKSNRRSEENLSKDSTPSENSNDTNDDKNKNEPVFFIHDNTVKDIPEDKRKISCSSTEMSSNTDATMAESDKIQTRGVQYLRNFRLRSTSRMESNKDVAVSNKDSDFQKKDIHTKSFEETVDVPQQKEVAETKEIPKDLKTTTDNTRVLPPLPVFKVEINKMKIDSSKEILHNADKQTEQEDASNSQVLIDPITGVLASVSDSYSEPVCQQRSENKIKDSGNSVSVLSIKNLSKSGPLSEIASATSVIQENSKSNYINKTENFPERPSLVQCLRSRQVTDSLPQTGTNDVMPVSSENISKQPSLPEKESEPLKLNAKKNSVAASVLTMVNCIGSSASNNTVTLTDPVNTINSAYTQNSQGQSPVITRTISSLDTSQIKAPSHGYEPSIRTTAVVTLTPTNHLTQNVSAGQNKSSTTSISTSNKSELPSVYTSANIPPTSINEHISSQTSCKPLSLGVSLPAEHSNILIKQEINVPSSSSHNIPVPSTWPSSKLPTNRITDSHVHLSGAHAHSANVGVISDILQNQYLQPKEYNMSSDQHYDRNLVQMVRSSTPITSNIPPEIIRPIESPHITTPPITSANHSLPSAESHSHGNSTLHLRQPPLMVSAHTSRALHHPELATLMHQQIMFSPFSHHSDLRVQPDVRTMGMNSHYGYSAMPSSADVSSNFKQPSQHRHHSTIMDAKAEQKGIDELSKVRHETRNIEEKSRSKSMRNKKEYAAAQKEKELKMIYSETRDDADSGRLLSSTSAIAPHSSRQPQHAHFASPILQMSPHIPSPHDRTTDSPVIANIYSVQGRISQLPLAGQVDDRGLGAHTSHLYKTDATEGIKPPIAHQTQPSTSPYHARQQLLGVPTIGSSAPAHIDIRSSNPAHSPNSIAYKKDAQQIASIHNARTLSRQGATSVSPGSGTYLCIPTDHVVPPPAHTASPSTTVAIGPQLIPPHLVYQDPYVMQNYPVVWQGSLALKNDQAIVQMHYVSGNIAIAQESLPHGEYEAALLRIAQRMRLEPQQLEGVRKKTQLPDEHCVLLALPCGKNNFELYQQSEKLKTGFIQYLDKKAAAGIVNAAPPGSQQPAYVIHIFPACEFTSTHVAKTAPDLFKIFVEMANVVIVIATV
ncbi:protein split ends [Caerostris extrusa]|uniref:Protein split ends n=1 Tax=Caerostris extrusa TaxID=172846 RepID=A0AAV4WDY7_CAEEX|nr:protein split ends [Caerostris extrusa]